MGDEAKPQGLDETTNPKFWNVGHDFGGDLKSAFPNPPRRVGVVLIN